jgi:WD40 repeat protein
VTLRGHTGAVAALAFSPDGSTLASVAADGSLRIWAVAQGAPIGTLATSAKPLEAVAFVDRAHIAAGGADGLLRLLDCDVCAPVPRLLAVARSRARIG